MKRNPVGMNKIPTPFISLQSDFGFKRAFGTERFRSALPLFLDALLVP
ncbi:MAG: Rpn family recombination-promoting nuclease/putative transposase [Muribaculaceae bacterium]|nr:Rpn family recombination-promoting nuclease/putative transposase [Muribaculaceae bacterium]